MTGSRFVDTVLVALSSLVAIALLGIFVYTEMLYTPPPIDENAALERMRNQLEEQGLHLYKLDKFVVNIPSGTTRLRYADIEIQLVSFEPSAHQAYETHVSRIRDLVIKEVGAMSPEELNTVTGRILLEDRLRRGINQIVRKNAVKEILFPKFIIQ
jgi:flagellar protein FliL